MERDGYRQEIRSQLKSRRELTLTGTPAHAGGSISISMAHPDDERFDAVYERNMQTQDPNFKLVTLSPRKVAKK